MQLPWFKKGDYYFDVLNKQLFYLSEGGEPVSATYSFASVAKATEGAWVRMDTNARDIETDKTYLFYQWFVSILRAGLIYRQYPIGEQVGNTDKLTPDTSLGQEYACFDNKMSPYNNPSEDTEFWMIKGQTIGFKYFNNQPFALVQKLKFHGRKFKQAEVIQDKPHPLTGEIVTEEMFNRLKSIARPIYMRRIV
jgi:hypothetical protein